MNFTKILVLFSAVFLFAFCPNKETYKVYDDLGKETSYKKILKKAEEADIILFGELHNNPIIHWLQYELTKNIFEQVNDNIVLGAEMFEADDQLVINEYLGGHYNYDIFKKEAKLWPNNETDYQPLLDFAVANQLSFIATNVPRRYANMVYKDGFKAFNSLTDDAKKYMVPIPFIYDEKLPGYVNMKKMDGGHGGDNLPKSQALKDATMAHFILKNWSKGKIFIHYNGTYHSNNFEGIMWYLKHANPDLKVLTIASVEQEKIDSLAEKNKGLAHFIIATPESMTKTY